MKSEGRRWMKIECGTKAELVESDELHKFRT